MLQESLKTSNTETTTLINKNSIEVKVESYDLHDSIVNISKHNKTISNSSELLQNIDKSRNLITGRVFLKSNNSTI